MKLIKVTLAATIPLVLCMFIYWLGGGEWTRSEDLGLAASIGFALSVLTTLVANGEGWLD